MAEGSGGGAPALRPKDIIANYIKGLGKSPAKGGNRLTLLRDADGDGTYEMRGVFADNLNAPYGLALVNGAIYVANQDALVRFDYRDGQTKASGPPAKVTDLPSAINHHWTKAMTASADGRFLYVGIGSNSNITERGMEAEVDRAMVWQIDAANRRAQALCNRPSQPDRARHPAGNGPALGGGERARRNRPQSCSGLPDFRARGRLLRLALQLLGPERRPTRAAARSREGRLGHPPGL